MKRIVLPVDCPAAGPGSSVAATRRTAAMAAKARLARDRTVIEPPNIRLLPGFGKTLRIPMQRNNAKGMPTPTESGPSRSTPPGRRRLPAQCAIAGAAAAFASSLTGTLLLIDVPQYRQRCRHVAGQVAALGGPAVELAHADVGNAAIGLFLDVGGDGFLRRDVGRREPRLAQRLDLGVAGPAEPCAEPVTAQLRVLRGVGHVGTNGGGVECAPPAFVDGFFCRAAAEQRAPIARRHLDT